MSAIKGFFWKLSDFLRSDSQKLFNIVAGKNGQMYEIRKELIGTMVSRADYVAELEEIPTGFQYGLPKIPNELLSQTINFFRHYCTEWNENEVMVQIFWDTVKRQYVIDCPYQWVKFDRINATFKKSLEDHNRYIEVCHIHSHNIMSSVFSSTDDENEQSFMIYGVVGRLHRKIPDIQLRVGYNGKFFMLPLHCIFEDPMLEDEQVSFPEAWKRRVNIIQG